jgi:putative acetyltransferase
VIEIRIENPDQPEVAALLQLSDEYMATLYPAESNHMLDIASLKRDGVAFVVARVDGRVLGCGAVVDSGKGWAEIKRMFVSPAARGQRLGRRLLQTIEAIALERGATRLRLETGVKQPEALSLYQSAGFSEIGPFGGYSLDPHSVFMEKSISASAGNQ